MDTTPPLHRQYRDENGDVLDRGELLNRAWQGERLDEGPHRSLYLDGTLYTPVTGSE